MKAMPTYIASKLRPEHVAGAQAYRELLEAHRRAGRLAAFYREIDARYPNLEPDTRRELADQMYGKQMSDNARAHWTRTTRE